MMEKIVKDIRNQSRDLLLFVVHRFLDQVEGLVQSDIGFLLAYQPLTFGPVLQTNGSRVLNLLKKFFDCSLCRLLKRCE